ncbi:MAG: hypothetical protein Q9170_008198 [Blastenia crenularia]
MKSDGKDPIDSIEKKAGAVPVPAPSLKSTTDPATTKKVSIKNCQDYQFDLVDTLVTDGTFPPEARKILDGLPKN